MFSLQLCNALSKPGLIAQFVVSLIVPEVMRLTPAQPHTLMEIDLEIISEVILSHLLIQEGLLWLL